MDAITNNTFMLINAQTKYVTIAILAVTVHIAPTVVSTLFEPLKLKVIGSPR